jgi:membrane protease YdiL (CAAX protease family)
MRWRLAIAASGFALFAVVARLADPVVLRLVLAGAAAICIVVALMPDYVLRFFRDNWRPLVRLLVSLSLLAGALTISRRNMAAGSTLGAVQAVFVLLEIAYILRDPTFRSWVAFLTIDQWRAIDKETDRKPGEAGTTSWKVLVVLVVCAVSLTVQEYIGDRGAFERWFPSRGRVDEYNELKGFAWWSSWRVIGYVIMPLLAIVAMSGERIRDYHMSFKGFTKHLWIYVLMFTLITPAVIIASTTQAFRHTYPFYRLANRSHFDLWTWEAFYAAQFVSLEIFFRGFLLHGLRRAFGANAIFVMIVPYCMIHYGKPLPETLGAIGAGVILGTLAMRTRSIWGGVLIHIGVAVTMDVLALRGCPPFGSNKYCGG